MLGDGGVSVGGWMWTTVGDPSGTLYMPHPWTGIRATSWSSEVISVADRCRDERKVVVVRSQRLTGRLTGQLVGARG